jgi:glycosyltransferase involved in cell wall biosynthesis
MMQIPTGSKLRIALECRIEDPRSGVGTAVLGLAHALSESAITSQEYTFIVNKVTKEWLAPHIFGPCRMVEVNIPVPSSPKRALGKIVPLRSLWRGLKTGLYSVPKSNGYVESENFDLVHFVTPVAYATSLPSIYQPHDLQHLHFPQFFSKTDYMHREKSYRDFCRRSVRVCVQTVWTKRDLISHYGLAPEKVAVIPWGSALSTYKAPSIQVQQESIYKYSLPDQFFFYPAVTWPHKNHEVIIRALYLLKHQYGRCPDVFFTGRPTKFRATLDRIAQELGVFEQLHYLGFVEAEELRVILSVATSMIFASKFEGFGLPILEAFDARLPVISSNASVLPEVAQDAALYFDPDSADELAAQMNTMLSEPEVRHSLIEKGTTVLSQYCIENVAVKFQALYEEVVALAESENH